MLTLHQLEVFAVVAEEMSVGRAADRLNVTQPAVSASLASLQREVGATLIVREGRGIRLTAAGREMQRYSELVIGLVNECVERTREAEMRSARSIRIGATPSLVTHVIAPILATIRTEYDSFTFSLEIGNRSAVWRQLVSHEIDIGLTSSPPSHLPIRTVATMPSSWVLVAKPGTVWAGHLDKTTWLIREEGATTRSASDRIIAQLGIDPPVMVIGSDDAIRGSAEAGLGAAVLPAPSVADALRNRSLVALNTDATPLAEDWHLAIREADNDEVLNLCVERIVGADDRFVAVGPDGTKKATRRT